jgi:hypothetical protein
MHLLYVFCNQTGKSAAENFVAKFVGFHRQYHMLTDCAACPVHFICRGWSQRSDLFQSVFIFGDHMKPLIYDEEMNT